MCSGGTRLTWSVVGFSETMEVRCVAKWGSPTTSMTVFKSGNIKIVGVRSRDQAMFVLQTFMLALRKVKGYSNATLDMQKGFKLGV